MAGVACVNLATCARRLEPWRQAQIMPPSPDQVGGRLFETPAPSRVEDARKRAYGSGSSEPGRKWRSRAQCMIQCYSARPFNVMAGLVPAIHVFLQH